MIAQKRARKIPPLLSMKAQQFLEVMHILNKNHLIVRMGEDINIEQSSVVLFKIDGMIIAEAVHQDSQFILENVSHGTYALGIVIVDKIGNNTEYDFIRKLDG